MINIIITSVAVRFLSVSDTMRVMMSIIITSVAVRFLSVSNTMRVKNQDEFNYYQCSSEVLVRVWYNEGHGEYAARRANVGDGVEDLSEKRGGRFMSVKKEVGDYVREQWYGTFMSGINEMGQNNEMGHSYQ